MRFLIFVSAIIEFLTQLPTAFPSFFMRITRARIAEYPLSVNGAEAGQGVAQCPAFVQSGLQSVGFLLRITHCACLEFVYIRLALIFGDS